MPKSINVNVSYCKYTVVRNAIQSLDWTLTDDQEDTTTLWNLWWQDVGISTDKLIKMKDFQRINHWPGMNSIHTKTGLATVIRRMEKVFPDEYRNIHPQTWSLPEDWTDFVTQFDPSNTTNDGSIENSENNLSTKKPSRPVYIIKPAASCQGRGIYLVQDLNQIQDNRAAQIAQRYISKPLLVDGLKFDLRIYVCLTSVDPLRIWLFEEGLARFATTPYKKPNASNLHKVTQHLTNYAINCQSSSFQFNTGGLDNGTVGSKRTLTWFRSWLNKTYGEGTANIVWGSIIDMIIKTLIAAQPHLARTYRSAVGTDATSMRCFEVLGLDVLIDADLKPWILEINHSPSLTCDTPLDTQIKFALIKETIQLLRLRGGDRKRNEVMEAAAARQRLYGSSLPLNMNNADTKVTDTDHSSTNNNDAQSVPSSTGLRTASLTTSTGSLTSVDDENINNSPMLPVHVRATAPSFTAFASAIPEAHALHEMKIAKKYRLIFPPPDPTLIGENVWKLNGKAYATTKGNFRSNNVDTLNDNDDDDPSSVSSSFSPLSSVSSTTPTVVSPAKSIVALPPAVPSKTTDGITMENGTPFPFYAPWDETKEKCLERINHYHYLLAVSTELYNVQSTVNATGGRKAANAALQSTASLITEAMKTMGKPSILSLSSGTPSNTIDGNNHHNHELSTFARTLKSISVSVVEKAASASVTTNKGGKPSFVSMINKVQAAKRVSTAPAQATRKSILKKENVTMENRLTKDTDPEGNLTTENANMSSAPLSPASISPNSVVSVTRSSPSQYLPRTSPPTLPGRSNELTKSPMIVPNTTDSISPILLPMDGSVPPEDPTPKPVFRPIISVPQPSSLSMGATILNSMSRGQGYRSLVFSSDSGSSSNNNNNNSFPKHIVPSNMGTSTTITANPWLLPTASATMIMNGKNQSTVNNTISSSSSMTNNTNGPYYKGYGNTAVIPYDLGLLGKSLPISGQRKNNLPHYHHHKQINPTEFLRPSTVSSILPMNNPYQQYAPSSGGGGLPMTGLSSGPTGSTLTGSFAMVPNKPHLSSSSSLTRDKGNTVSLQGKAISNK